MNNDLISRSALKEKLAPIKLYDGVYCKAITDKDIDDAPTVEPKFKPIAEVKFDHEQLKEIVDKAIIRCQNCKHQKKYWHEDRRMKEKGYWIYGCDLIDDSFVGTPVWGADNQFCSSAERRTIYDN